MKLFGSNWCTQERCSNYQKKACLERTEGGETVHYELNKRLFDIWGERAVTKGWTDSKKAPPEVWAEIYRTKQTPLRFKGVAKRSEKKPLEPQPSTVATPPQPPAGPVQIFNPTYHHFGQPFQNYQPPPPSTYMAFGPPPPYNVQPPYAATIQLPQSHHQELVNGTAAPPSSPIKTREPDRVLEELSLWLKNHIPASRYSIIVSGIRTIIDQGFTLEDIRDLPAKDFMDIGVKAAVLSLIKPHLRTFKRQYKQRQETQAATSLTELHSQGRRSLKRRPEPAPQGTQYPYPTSDFDLDLPSLRDIIGADDEDTQSYDYDDEEEKSYRQIE
jgi:hypothetical protein